MNTNTEHVEQPDGRHSLDAVVSCGLCGTESPTGEITHLRLYVIGSEGVEVCMTCRQTLTEMARGMRRVHSSGRMQGYKAAKIVAAAKAANRDSDTCSWSST